MQMNTQIATSTEEQSSVAEEINRNIVNIHDISKQTTVNTAQTSDASVELARLDKQLQTLISQFKT